MEESITDFNNKKSKNSIVNENFNNVLYENNDEDLICEHKEFPFCDCLANFAKQGSVSPSSPPAVYSEILPRNEYLNDNIKFDYQIKAKSHLKRIPCGKPVDLLGSPLGFIIRESVLEVLKEDDENDSEIEGAVGGDLKTTYTGYLEPIGPRRASIVTADSRKNSLLLQPEPIRIAVFGKDGVGKSALIVRLVTGRFIGEYDPSMEAIYNYQIPLSGHDLPLQVMDTAGTVDVSEEGRERQVSWGEGFILVFSLTNHSSLSALQHIRRVLVELTPGSPRPLILVGNKADLSHSREVTTKEIFDLADMWGCDYYEVSAAEPWDVVVRPFLAIYQAVLEARRC